MLVGFDAAYKGDTERALLRYWGEWMRAKKRHKKHIQRIYPRSEYCRERREARIIDAEIEVLKTCINQIHALRRMRSRPRVSGQQTRDER